MRIKMHINVLGIFADLYTSSTHTNEALSPLRCARLGLVPSR